MSARPGWWRTVRARLARLSPPLAMAFVSAALALALLQFRHVDSRARTWRSVGTLDDMYQARLHVTRAYLIVRAVRAADATFTPVDAVAELDRAALAVSDWLSARDVPARPFRGRRRDPELRRLVLAYDRRIAGFRAQLLDAGRGAADVDARAAFASLETLADSIGYRLAAVNGEVRRGEERDHALTVFLLTFFILTSGVVLHHVTRRRAQALEALRVSEAQLRQAQKMEALGRLAGGVAHDFNNVLGVILLSARLLLDALDPADDRHADAREIVDAGERGARLIAQLLAVGRQQPQARTVVDLGQLLRDMEPMLRRLVGDGVRLDLSAPAGCCRVLADLSQLEQVVLNLAANARDAMAREGVLTLRAEPAPAARAAGHAPPGDGAHAQLVVADTGCGMDEATRSRIFEPFYTTKPTGTGLGLATVYGIVEQSGGTIRVESAPGRGTTFVVLLPALDGPVPPPAGQNAIIGNSGVTPR